MSKHNSVLPVAKGQMNVNKKNASHNNKKHSVSRCIDHGKKNTFL